ncbi:hypothetical protein ACP0HM_05760 [Escherichia coli]
MATVRSHDQYNTTIYGMDDRYRGVFGQRDVVFMSAKQAKICRVKKRRKELILLRLRQTVSAAHAAWID